MEGTHIKIDRKILQWEWYNDSNMVHLFIYLLLRANWKDGNWRGTPVKRGQLITGRLKVSRDTGLSERQIRTCFSKLKSTNEIAIKSTNQYSIITICKYDTYQENKNDNDQQQDQQLAIRATNERPASDQQATTIEEGKKKKKERIEPKEEQKLKQYTHEKKNKTEKDDNNEPGKQIHHNAPPPEGHILDRYKVPYPTLWSDREEDNG